MIGKNNVNNLTGKDWLKNAINFWNFETFDIEAIYNKFLNFCYKNRTESGILKNINKISIKVSDFSFNYIKSFKDAEKSLETILKGAYNSYHAVFLESEFIEDSFLPSYYTANLDIDGIEYRGKIVINIKDSKKTYISLLFLNRLKEKINEYNFKPFDKIRHLPLNSYVIESKSKIDKIGLKHPAPYSYIDIKELTEIENIKNQTILDPFLGVASTIIGTYENNYNIGIELNKTYVSLIKERFDSINVPEEALKKSTIICGDSLTEIDKIKHKIDSVITSPPYFNILKNKTSGVRTDKSQSRQGIDYYSDNNKDFGNINNYEKYLESMQNLFTKIRKKMSNDGNIYLIISDFTINKREKDIHSDFVKLLSNCGYLYSGTSYIFQNQKAIYPFGYPYKLVINHIFQYIIKFKVEK